MKHMKSALLALLFTLAPFVMASAEEKIKINDIIVGDGEEAVDRSRVSVDYTGWLLDGGKQFDSSIGRSPLTFTLGAGMVISGWDQGVKGMKVGGKRELIIPPHLAYGDRGTGKIIPPGSTLRFEVELLDIVKPRYSNINNEELKQLLARGTKIVDVRHPEEWRETGIVKGSILSEAFVETGRLRREFITELAQNVKKDEPVILICRTGNRTNVLSEGLSEQFGYTKIYNVTKGIVDWIDKGNPVVSP